MMACLSPYEPTSRLQFKNRDGNRLPICGRKSQRDIIEVEIVKGKGADVVTGESGIPTHCRKKLHTSHRQNLRKARIVFVRDPPGGKHRSAGQQKLVASVGLSQTLTKQRGD